jgi:heptosyltransferase II
MRTLRWAIATVILSPFLLLNARMRRSAGKKKMLVIQLAMLGDLVATTPIFRAIKETYPNIELHVLCRRNMSGAIKNNPFIDKIYYDEGNRYILLSHLRRERYDWSIGCMPSTFAAIVGLWSAVPYRINTSSKHCGMLLRILSMFNQYNEVYQIRTHTFDHYMRLASFMNVKPISYQLDFGIPEEVRESCMTWKESEGLIDDHYIIVNVTAGNPVKEWSPENFITLANYITGTLNKHVVISTLDQSLVKKIMENVSDSTMCHDGSGLSLSEFGALCKGSSAYVSVDTGPLYIAYACGTPVVIIVGPIDVREQVPPAGDRVAYVMPPEGCKPWVFVSKTPREGNDEQIRCIRETSVESVVTGLTKVLK